MAAAPGTYDRRGRLNADALVESHLSLVRRIAWHVHGRMSSAIEVEDLIQTGMVALIEAARAYEDRGNAFATYASLRVRGAMIDSLRKHSAQLRSASAGRRAIAAAENRLLQTLGRMPLDQEMAHELNMPIGAFADMRLASQSLHHDSLDEAYSDHSLWFADQGDMADTMLEKAQLQSALTDAITRLGEREAMVLQLYFVEELNLDEIGAVLNVGAARICQIKKSALEKVRHMVSAGT